MTIHMRPYIAHDFPAIDALMHVVPVTTPHRYDFPWRFTSPTVQTGRDIYVWYDNANDKELLAFGAWQYPWALLDFAIRPGSWQEDIEAQLFTWAEQHFQTLNRESGNTYPYWVEFRDDDVERQALVTRYSYTIAHQGAYVFMERPLDEPIPEPTLPQGFALRSMDGKQEVEAYVALHRAAFESTSMTVEWRTRTLTAPRYSPDFNIVAVAPDGTLAGFCVAWFDEHEYVGQIEPLGVHPQFQRLGLARALMLEMFRRFQLHGARSIFVETNDDREAARATYYDVGFRVTHTYYIVGKYV